MTKPPRDDTGTRRAAVLSMVRTRGEHGATKQTVTRFRSRRPSRGDIIVGLSHIAGRGEWGATLASLGEAVGLAPEGVALLLEYLAGLPSPSVIRREHLPRWTRAGYEEVLIAGPGVFAELARLAADEARAKCGLNGGAA